ncbi:tigger transposable element-derived protein 1 [Trichonephila clavipes]|nr:tigger transposable element-derived protein 1 [Trichonephila clavipes]
MSLGGKLKRKKLLVQQSVKLSVHTLEKELTNSSQQLKKELTNKPVLGEVVDLSGQINLEVDSDDVQDLLDFHNQKLTMDLLLDMHKQQHVIEELESLYPVQSEDRMMVGNLTEGLNIIEKGLQILENVESNEEHIFSTKKGIKKLLAYYTRKFCWRKKKNSVSRQTTSC